MHATLADAVDALEATGRGLHFTAAGRADVFLPFADLAGRVRATAARFLEAGCAPGDRVVLVVADQCDFVRLFLAAVRAGLVAVPASPPAPGGDPDQHAAAVARIVRTARARVVVAGAGDLPPGAAAQAGARALGVAELDAGAARATLPRVRASDPALIQFTSGSTGAPRGVALTHANLVANAMAIAGALALDPARDRGASWLPMHHDMGLVGFLITPVLIQGATWYLPPREFAARPQRWLDLLSRSRASVSFAPAFGYEHVLRRVRPAEAGAWDLSAWRVAGCGGEPILPGALARFAALLRPAGFAETALLPCYGLAEATLAVAVSPPGRGVVTRPGADGRPLVASGRVVRGTEVRVVSPAGAPLPEGAEGEIEVRGAGVGARVWTESGPGAAARPGGWVGTGDLGAMIGGELHVSGRVKEVVIVNGRKLHPRDIEACADGVEGVRPGRAAAFGRPGAGSEEAVLAVEARPGADPDALRRALRARVRAGIGVALADVVLVGRDAIPRTTSGKLRRSEVRRRYLAGELGAATGARAQPARTG